MGFLDWFTGGDSGEAAPQEDWRAMPDHEKCQHARQLERDGGDRVAERIYKHMAAEGFTGNFPYDRLAIIYRKRKDYEREAAIMTRAMEVFNELPKQRPDRKKKLAKFRKRRKRARELAG